MSPIDLLRAPPGATSRELRVLGAKGLGIGVPVFVAGLSWYLFSKDRALDELAVRTGASAMFPRWMFIMIGGPMFLGYALVMIGLSRLLFGAAAESKSALASLGRIVFGVVATVGTIVVATVIFIMASRP